MLAFRRDHLVYIPITKNASTSYINIFRQLKWEETDTSCINWHQDHVFAHWQDPYERHAKGTVEALEKLGMLDLIEDTRIHQLLATAVFDLHSYPLVPTFGEDWCRRIDWIPLQFRTSPSLDTPPDRNSTDLTEIFLRHHGVDVDLRSFPKLYESDSSKKQLVKKVKQIRDTVDCQDTLTYFYDRDIVLSNQIHQHFFWWNNTEDWNKISWLKNYEKYNT